MLKTLTPNLMVADVNETIAFYQNVLGFKLTQTVPDEGDFVWASVQNGDVELMFQTRESLSEEYPPLLDIPLGGSLSLFIRMDQIDELYTIVKGQVSIQKELHTTFYGMREFAIQDPNGYILVFAEAI
jgi:uncharacterized glyoxalase superfamily protein PhnB